MNGLATIGNTAYQSQIINGMESEWFNCTSGVRQGDVLSTTLFSIFISPQNGGL